MGVLGLSTFVHRHSDKFLLRQRVSDEPLLIDGDNWMYYLVTRTRRLNLALGGEYLRLEYSARFFIEQLKKCRVLPIVLFDGGSDPSGRKRKTQQRRLTEKVAVARRVTVKNQHHFCLLPHLAKIVLIETLQSLRVQCAVCDCEADEHLAALAVRLGCAVLSDDTDFFAFGVRCVLLSSLGSEACYDDSTDNWFLDANVFCNDKFVSEYGMARPMLPLLFCLQGNDYLPSSLLAKFYRHHITRLPAGARDGAVYRSGSLTQRRVLGLLLWLRRHTSPYHALEQVLQHVPKPKRDESRRAVLRCMHNYTVLPDELVSSLQLELPPLPPDIKLADAVPNNTAGTMVTNMAASHSHSARSPTTLSSDFASGCAIDEHQIPGDSGDQSEEDEEDTDGEMSNISNTGNSDCLTTLTPTVSKHHSTGADVDTSAHDQVQSTTVGGVDSSAIYQRPVAPFSCQALPRHLLTAVRTGRVTASVINMINGVPVVFDPQVEDFSVPSPALLVLPLLSVQRAILEHLLDRPLAANSSALLRNQQCHVARVPLPPFAAAVAARVHATVATAAHARCRCSAAVTLLGLRSQLNANLFASCSDPPMSSNGANTDGTGRSGSGVGEGPVLLWTAMLVHWWRLVVVTTTSSSSGSAAAAAPSGLPVLLLTSVLVMTCVLDSDWLMRDHHSCSCAAAATAACRRRMSRWRQLVWRRCGAWLNRCCAGGGGGGGGRRRGGGGGGQRSLTTLMHWLSLYQLCVAQTRNMTALLQLLNNDSDTAEASSSCYQLPPAGQLYSGVVAAAAALTAADGGDGGEGGVSGSCCCRHGAVRCVWLPPCRPLASLLLAIRQCVMRVVMATTTTTTTNKMAVPPSVCNKCAQCTGVGFISEDNCGANVEPAVVADSTTPPSSSPRQCCLHLSNGEHRATVINNNSSSNSKDTLAPRDTRPCEHSSSSCNCSSQHCHCHSHTDCLGAVSCHEDGSCDSCGSCDTVTCHCPLVSASTLAKLVCVDQQ